MKRPEGAGPNVDPYAILRRRRAVYGIIAAAALIAWRIRP